MKLIFDLVKILDDTSVKSNCHFDENGGFIGRSEDATWHLDDNKNYISNKHLEISYKNGFFYAKDVSTNGTFLKYPHKKLPNGKKIKVNNTDIFIIGDYEIQARFFNNDYTKEDIVSNQTNIDDDFIGTFGNSNSNRNIIPDDFSLLDDNISGTLLDEIEEEVIIKEDILDNFSDGEKDENINESFLDTKHIEDIDEDIEDVSISNNTLNEHITLPRFKEEIKYEPKEEKVKKEEKKKRKKKIDIPNNNLSFEDTAHKVNEMQAMESLLVLEKKLGINIVTLTQSERDIVLSEIASIVLNSLDGIKQSIDINEKIKDDILQNTKYKKEQRKKNNKEEIISDPIKLGKSINNILDISIDNTMKISDSIKESFNELNQHNIALHKTSKNLVNISLDKFAPEHIESNFKKRGKTVPFLPKNIQIWKEYKLMYANLKIDNMGEELIKKDFLKEYKKNISLVNLKEYNNKG